MTKLRTHWLVAVALAGAFLGCNGGGTTQDSGTQDSSTQDSSTQDVASHDAATQDVAQGNDGSTTDGGDMCASNTTCGDCTAVDGCGWCANTNQCLSGSDTGPSGGQCSGAQWSWTPDMCPGAAAQCAMATNCGDCTAMDGCGWCGAMGRCFNGTDQGPDGNQCMMADWAWMSDMCGGADAGSTDASHD